eukprot:5963286-Heterocapsa_arctica.AAC.1
MGNAAFLWRNVCGGWSQLKLSKGLRLPCLGIPSSPFHKYSLSRLARGLAPIPALGAGVRPRSLEVV